MLIIATLLAVVCAIALISIYSGPSKKRLHERLYIAYSRFQSFCENERVPFFAIGGTLLGVVRDGAIITHDDDIDVGMRSDVYRKFLDLLPRWAAAEPDVLFKFDWSGRTFVSLFINGSQIDVFEFERRGGRHVMTAPYWNEYLTDDELAVTSNRQFGKKNTVPVPKNSEAYLERVYGDDWQTPKLTHCHTSTCWRDHWICSVLWLLLTVSVAILLRAACLNWGRK